MEPMKLVEVPKSTANENKSVYHLWWFNKTTNKKFSAGRAFYSNLQGDFSLLINLFENSRKEGRKEEYYLRATSSANGCTFYTLEKVIHKNDRRLRFSIGEGFQSKQTGGDIYIHIEPLTGYSKKLVLSLNEQKGKDNE